MSQISVLQEQLGRARETLAAYEADRRNIDDFAALMTRESLLAHIDDLCGQLRRAKLDRAVEVVQIRLIGERAHEGSLPLYLLSRVSDQFGAALHAASQKIKTGRQVLRISNGVVALLNLRLADMGTGSSRLYITGDVAPDLFGHSLLEQSLDETFSVFEAPSEDELASAVSGVGIRSARAIREFLQTVKDAELEVEVSWNAPDDQPRRWSGEYQHIARLARSLSHFQVREPTRISVKGEVVTVSLRGRFELQSSDRNYTGTFPSDLLHEVAALHIGDEVTAELERTTILNTVTKVEKVDYTLLHVYPTGQTRFA
jgi:hypothetical protein